MSKQNLHFTTFLPQYLKKIFSLKLCNKGLEAQTGHSARVHDLKQPPFKTFGEKGLSQIGERKWNQAASCIKAGVEKKIK